MKSNWNDMNKKEKKFFIVYCVIALIGSIFAVLDFSGKREHADLFWMISLAAFLIIECVENWKEKRKLAIVELIGGIIMLAFGIAEKFI